MALDVKSSSEVHPTSEHPSTSLSLVEDEDGSKDSTLVDENSLEDTGDSVSDGDNFSKVKDDNSNLTGGLRSKLEDSQRKNKNSGSQRTDKKPTLCISLSEGQRASASSLSSGSSGPDQVSTPKRSGSPAITMDVSPIPQMTSTPIPSGSSGAGPNLSVQPSTSGCSRPQSLSVNVKTASRSRESLTTESTGDDVNTSFTSQTSTHTTTHESQTDLDLYDQLQVPIIGYETMEERSRFTVFKVRVQKSVDEAWYIFRRYSDFVRLNETLKQVFPHFRLALPPKKWFGDNYDRSFLEDRLLGLQAFLNNVISHRDVCNSEALRDFLCIDDPPGPHDSLEESRAQCELLEDQVYCLRQDLQTRDSRIALLEEELSLYKAEVDNLRRSLRMERALNTHRRCSPTSHSQRSEGSITEHDEASEAEADQGACPDKPSAPSSVMTSPEGASTYSWDVISSKSGDTNKTSSDVTSSTMTSPIATTVTEDTVTTKTALSIVEEIQKVTSPSINGVTSLVDETRVPATSLTKETCVVGATTVSMNGDGPMSKHTTEKLQSALVS